MQIIKCVNVAQKYVNNTVTKFEDIFFLLRVVSTYILKHPTNPLVFKNENYLFLHTKKMFLLHVWVLFS